MSESQFKVGDIVWVNCSCGGDRCLSGQNALVIGLVSDFATLFVPGEHEDRGGYRFAALTKIGEIDQ